MLSGGDDDVDRDSWCTERALAVAIGDVDLDPCSNDRSHIRATHRAGEVGGRFVDGLVMSRYMRRTLRTFINPPYSRGQVERWVAAYRHTRFTFLLRFDPSTDWFASVWSVTTLAAFPRQRIEFEPPPGVPSSSNPYPHVLLYADERDVSTAIHKLCYVTRKVP